jgi:hypothetical protein
MRLALLELSVAQNNPARGSLQLERKGGEKSKGQKAVLSADAFRTRNSKLVVKTERTLGETPLAAVRKINDRSAAAKQ